MGEAREGVGGLMEMRGLCIKDSETCYAIKKIKVERRYCTVGHGVSLRSSGSLNQSPNARCGAPRCCWSWGSQDPLLVSV